MLRHSKKYNTIFFRFSGLPKSNPLNNIDKFAYLDNLGLNGVNQLTYLND